MTTHFAVGSPDSSRSAVWTLWRHTNPLKSDVFLAARQLAAVFKISFHERGETRHAFTFEFQHRHGTLSGGRARHIWRRPDYDEAGIIRLYQVCIPFSELRAWPLDDAESAKSICWIPRSPAGNAVFVEMLLTRPGLTGLEIRGFAPATAGPLVHWFLPSGENFLVLPRIGRLDEPALLAIRAAVSQIEQSSSRLPLPTPSTRLNLILDAPHGFGVTIESAWPSTIGTSA